MLQPELTDMEEMLIELLVIFSDSIETYDECTEFTIFSDKRMITVTLEWHEV